MQTLLDIVSVLREYGAEGRFTAFKCNDPSVLELKDESGKNYVYNTQTGEIKINVERRAI